MYDAAFCKVYNEFGWNYYPEVFGEQLLQWLSSQQLQPRSCMDLACGTGILCRLLQAHGIEASGMDFSAGMIELARQNAPGLQFEQADMIRYRPDRIYDLVTCTGDALNHIPALEDLEQIFQNVYAYTAPGGHFVFDLLNEQEVSDSEPFEMQFDANTRVWFQMTRPARQQVQLQIQVYEADVLQVDERICETIHDPQQVCALLRRSGFELIQCADHLGTDAQSHGSTWFVIARRPAAQDFQSSKS